MQEVLVEQNVIDSWLLCVNVLTELYGGLVNKTEVHNLETVLLTTLVHYSCERRRGAQPVNLMETVNLTQKYCAVRSELARAGETYCYEQLAMTKLDHELSASWLQINSTVDVPVTSYQLPSSLSFEPHYPPSSSPYATCR